MVASAPRRFILSCLCLALLAALPATAVAESEKPGSGVRATLFGQGLGEIAATSNWGPIIPVNYQLLAPPLLEGLFPVGVGDILLGLSYARTTRDVTYKDDDDERKERSAWGLAATVGFAFSLIANESNALRVGTRIGTIIGGDEEKTTWDDHDDDYDDEDPGKMVSAGVFLAAEHMFYRHFGFQGELGLTYLGQFREDRDIEEVKSWLSTYTAFSAVMRF